MEHFAIHQVLECLNALVILRVVRGGRECRFGQSFCDARMPAQLADLPAIGILKAMRRRQTAKPAHDLLV